MGNQMTDILLISPYHGGSHQAWAEGYRRYSQLKVDLLTLPARFWKWRMHGGAVTLSRQFMNHDRQPRVILATDMLDLTTFLALTRRRSQHVPTALYMHENQLTYPLPDDGSIGPMRRQLGERDQHYAFINYASMLAADLVFFNSDFHRQSFFAALPRFLKHFPEYNELGTVEELAGKCQVLPIGIDLRRLNRSGQATSPTIASSLKEPPLIIWNQRWEYDRNPADFFRALYEIQAEGIPFRLALCGQQFGRRPDVFDEAIDRLSDHVVHVGYAPESVYWDLLWKSSLIISTSHHEFFGISIVEAISCHTFPILPCRLSYPELISEPFHQRCLYHSQSGLLKRIRWSLTHPKEIATVADQLARKVQVYDWSQLASQYDARLSQLNQA
jgi:glycosyltransferase involved in cell wall biosynthesis